ncbi:MAG TPA: Ig-like domain repeat protein [Rudaea sp.]|nr:Ig-like domain repeat protein [Rudaea sp.]
MTFRLWLGLALVVLAGPALAAGPFTVNTTNDTHDANAGDGLCSDGSGQCSLRAALEQANASTGATTINLPPGTYNLTIGALIAGTAANTNISIHGTGTSANTIINQTVAHRLVFSIDYNVMANVVFELDNATVTGGSEDETDPDGFGGNGGAVLAGGSVSATGNAVTFNSVVFSGNYCSPSSNAGCSGGAINMTGGGDLTITNCTFSGNEAAKFKGTASGGGAVYFDAAFAGGNLTITNSTFTNNIAHSVNGQGGALYIGGGTSNVYTITGNTFTGNIAGASAQGGAIIIFTGVMTARYNRFFGNSAGTASGLYMSFGDPTPFRSVDARDNWWGCNGGPTAIGCDTIYPTTSTTPPLTNGQISFDPWIVLAHSASPGKISINQTSTLTASFLQDNHGGALSAGNLGALIGLPVTFDSAVLGTLSNAQTTIQSAGTATATFTAGSSGGNGSAHATVDNATATASITVVAPPTFSKSFGAPSIALTAATTLGFTINNPNATTALTGIGFSDTLPSGLAIATPNGLSGSCGGGTITATQNTIVVSLSGASLAAGASCNFSVNVTGTGAGIKNNTTGNISSVEGGAGATAMASITVNKTASSTALTTGCPTTFVANQPFTMTAAVTGYSPSGSATFDDGGVDISGCASVGLSGAAADCVTSGLPVGVRNLTAAYGGDSNNLSSNSASLYVSVLDPADVPFRNGFEAAIVGCPTK